jgi:hypothetical protein
MPLRFPRTSFHGAGTIDANSLDSRPDYDDLPFDSASVRQRSIAAILLQGIRRCIAADRDLNDDSSHNSEQDEPVLGNLGDSLPEPLDFVLDKPLSVSHVSETPGFGTDQDIQKGDKS